MPGDADAAERAERATADDAAAAEAAVDAAERGAAAPPWTKTGGDETSAVHVGDLRFLDPASPDFDLRDHIQQVKSLVNSLGYTRSQIDVTWSDLTVAVPGESEDQVPEISTFATNTGQCLGKPLSLVHKVQALAGRAGALCGIRKPSGGELPPDRLILKGLTGYARSGELTLIIGPPGSGCSTLCNVLSGQTRHYKAVRGDVRFNGTKLGDQLPSSLGLVAVGEADLHFPTLTVDQTIELATTLRTQLPEGHELRGQLIELRKTVTECVLGIHHVRNTLVGDELVRGVSGGERRRVTIAEMLSTVGRFLVLDAYSKGLDAATSLDIIKSLRIAARELGSTIIATQYQISKEIYEQFDNVVVLRESECICFGPIGEACAYFQGLNFRVPVRRTVPDLLSTLADDPVTFPEDADEAARTPQSVEELSEAYHQSQAFAECRQLVSEGMVRPPPAPAHQSEDARAFMARQYLVSWPTQFRLVFKREWRVKTQSPKMIIFRLVRFTVLGLLLGAAFWQLPENIDGAYSRGGFLYFALNYVALAALSQMSPLLDARQVFYKQRDADFYSPSSYFLASTAADIPLQFLETALFVNTTYWMIGLNTSPGSRFVYYWLALQSVNLMMSCFSRMATANSANLSAAQGKVVALVVIFIIFAGYLIPRNAMPPYLVWVNWVSPFKYVYEGLVVNEFENLCLEPSTTQLEGIEELATQLDIDVTPPACTPGTECIAFTYDVQIADYVKWLYLLVIWGITVVFAAAGVFYLKFYSIGGEQSVLKYKRRRKEAQWKVDAPLVAQFRRRNSERRKAHEAGIRRAEEQAASRMASEPVVGMRGTGSAMGTRVSMDIASGDVVDRFDSKSPTGAGAGIIPFQKALFEWRDMSYTVPTPSGPLTLLDKVSGYAHPGMLTALMGASGAGKTTLLDCLARRKTGGEITGSVTINGVPQDDTFKRYTGYVEQFDVLHPRLTVRETLQFSAALRLPPGTSKELRRQAVRDTEELLSLGHVADALVGNLGWPAAISLEQRKRLNIGIELVNSPSVLFMDEPTSGLDTNAAIVVMRSCRIIADAGRSVLCTIHQPSSELFEVFDTMLLLKQGGKTVYFGPLGAFSSDLIGYFERNGAPPCGEHANPADWMLMNIGAGITKQSGSTPPPANGVGDTVVVRSGEPQDSPGTDATAKDGDNHGAASAKEPRGDPANMDWAAIWAASPEAADVLKLLDKGPPPNVEPLVFEREIAQGFSTQFRQCLGRAFRAFWRTPESNFARMTFNTFLGLMIGLLFLQLDNSQQGLQLHVSVLFVGVIAALYNIMIAMPPLLGERAVLCRELAAGFYGPRAYGLAVAIVELPFVTASTFLYIFCFYFLVGFPASRLGYFIVMQLVFVFFAVFFGQACVVWLPSLVDAQQTVPTLGMLFQLFCGFLVPRAQIRGFLIWIYWINSYTYVRTNARKSATALPN